MENVHGKLKYDHYWQKSREILNDKKKYATHHRPLLTLLQPCDTSRSKVSCKSVETHRVNLIVCV